MLAELLVFLTVFKDVMSVNSEAEDAISGGMQTCDASHVTCTSGFALAIMYSLTIP